jgi:glycosyltransferase involved in cell wall biosynthesis
MKQLCLGIYCHEQPERLRETLESLRRNTASTVQVILLADGPDVRMRQALQGLDHIPQSGTAEAAGAAACFNRLANSTSAGIVVLLESGAQVGPSWLDHLLAALDSDPRNGLAGPSTNNSWNEQCVFRGSGDNPAEIATTATQAEAKFGNEVRTLEPLYSLADFCYAVRREVIEAVGAADEGYSLGPCWEMDYNIRAARAGWRGVWVCGAYVHRPPFTERRRREEARLFDASKRRYQDKFCGARLRGEKNDFRSHCRGDACPNFAPAHLIQIKNPPAPARIPPSAPTASEPRATVIENGAPLVTCIMPTCDRQRFVPDALRFFLRQDYPNLELVVVDDGTVPVAPLLPDDPQIRLIRLPEKKNVGAKRNIACAAARGELIVHWDDDDWYPADRVRRQIAALLAGRAEICGTSTLYYYDAASGRAWCYRYRNGGRTWVAGNTLAYRKSWWTAHPFPEIQVGEDSRFVWAAPRVNICDLGTPDLCVARIHPQNTSRKSQNGACWGTCPIAELEAVLGSEWPVFAGLAAAASPTETDLPLVSCIMPTYNRRSFLPLAIKAFESQDYPAKELIVVDDGSDPVGDIIEKVPIARYLRLPARTSIGAKRNLACTEARGAIIAHWDDDDWYGPERLRRQIAPLLAREADLTGLENSFLFEVPAGRFWGTHANLHRRMFVGDVHGGTLVFWKRLFDEGLRYPPTNIAEDAAFIQNAVRRHKRLVRVPNDGLFVYVRHGGNAWRFEPGRFLDPSGWRAITPPASFGPTETEAWQTAAASGAST